MPCWLEDNAEQTSPLPRSQGPRRWRSHPAIFWGPCLQPCPPSLAATEPGGRGYPSRTPGAIPGLAAITQDVEAAAALRRAGALGFGVPPEGQEPEHAHCHPHGSWLLCSPGRGLSLDCSVIPAQEAQQLPTGSSTLPAPLLKPSDKQGQTGD